ncbi:MarR family transcriptional regulator (plasmid) [Arthrobacter sp. zg-Y820]|uniref:MarR family transcriptional regulator n=1 Tax=Arthrobacter sp. zg-Y820 TaxID=2894192 RepID=UPI0025423910|nr:MULTISPECIES: MarR family transcriptional regulator [unclassified Arthrobacter]MCC9198540.1 MarR family transcriptional regulator [Arthrobacter sp. zg-Y820]MDK1281410.1 MarR family transcriptional regulator [Arthrobacter sp. zg.Y820]WIB11246.1 MarR family transcriptional regulator [Arthrobacter sp. zg-Y820]
MSSVPTSRDEPSQLWSSLAPLLAGQPRVRLSKDGGRSYPQRFERDLTPGLPSHPAAVRIFGKDGTCAAIFLDFDSSIAGVDWVEADVRTAQSLLHSVGGRWIEDYSPNGGRHLYIPLAERVSFSEARDLVEALGTRFRTLDKTPHQNLLHGCMRTPGSPHKRGGHQMLAMSLSMAYDVARRRNSADVWKALTAELARDIAAARAYRLEQATPAALESPGPAGVEQSLRISRAMQRIAVTGLYEVNRYQSDSEARQGVIAGAVAAGLALTEVQRRMKQGLWPGLASFYARYPARHRVAALQRDWRNALSFVQRNQDQPHGKNNVRISPTSGPPTQAGGLHGGNSVILTDDNEHRFIRSWRNALRLVEYRYQTRIGLARRMVLRALGEAAHKSASRYIEFGDRALAVATGMDHTTVGFHLRGLRSEKDPLVVLIEAGRGTKGDLYMLTIPETTLKAVKELPWKKGKVHALRPVFRELGLPAAFVYEALENSPVPLSTMEVVRTTGLSRTAATEALEMLAAWNLASRDAGWSVVAATSLNTLAEYFGVLEAVAAQIHTYRIQRAQWRDWLSRHSNVVPLLPAPEDDYPWEDFEGPPDDLTLADLAFQAAG